jgi:hypothetical protein
MRPLTLVSILYTHTHKCIHTRTHTHTHTHTHLPNIYTYIHIYKPRAPAGSLARRTPMMIQALFLGKLATAAHRVHGRKKVGSACCQHREGREGKRTTKQVGGTVGTERRKGATPAGKMGVRAHSPGSRGAGGALYASGARAGRVLCPVRHPLFHDFHTNGTGALLRAAPRIEGGAFMFSTLDEGARYMPCNIPRLHVIGR